MFRKPRPVLLSLLGASLLFGTAHAQTATPAPTVSETALRQIDALEADADARTPAQQKLSSQLIYAARMSAGRLSIPGVFALRTSVVMNGAGLTLVDIKADINPDLLQAIVRAGGTVVSASEQFGTIRATVPLSLVEQLAARTDVQFVRPAVRAHLLNPARVRPAHLNVMTPSALLSLKTRLRALTGDPGVNALPGGPGLNAAGSVDSQGDKAHQADKARVAFGVNGSGIKIGVLSDSLDDANGSYAAALASKDVSTVTVIKDKNGVVQDGGQGSAEGLAMLEIVHDLAPGAQLYFATAFNSEGSFADNIVSLQKAGCKIIIDDVGYYDEPPFQDGIVAQAVDTATKAGALYFSSAGNAGSLDSGLPSVWEGDFKDSGKTRSSGKVHSFGAQNYDIASIPYESQIYAFLFWSDPLGKSANDYDLFVLSHDGSTVVSSSTDRQTGAQDPIEGTTISDGEQIVVVQHKGSTRFLHVELTTDADASLAIGTTGNTHGHNSAVDAFCVAATDASAVYPGTFTSSDTTEYFSSDGPRRVFYDPSGKAYTSSLTHTGGKVLNKPEFTAADGVATTLPQGQGLNPFYGTSAAAPHAGAIAALLLSYNSKLTEAQVRSILQGSATDIMASGLDRDSGAGILNALKALQTAPVPTGTANLKAVTFDVGTVAGGQTTTGTVSLTAAAPTGGKAVTLKSSDTASATLPSSVTVAAGKTSATFTLTSKKVTANKTVTITATLGSTSKTATVTVTKPSTAVTPVSQTFNPNPANSSGTTAGTVTLSGNAPSGGAAVDISYAGSTILTLTVAAGQKTGTYTLTLPAVTASTSFTIDATLNGTTISSAFTVRPTSVSLSKLSFSPSTVAGGGDTTGTITLTATAPKGGAVVEIYQDGTDLGYILVTAGQKTDSFTFTPADVTSKTVSTMEADYNGKSVTTKLTVTPGSKM